MDNGFAIHLLLTEKMPGFLSKDGTDMNIVIYKQQAVDKEDYLLELKKYFSVSYMTNFNALNSDLYEIAKVLKLSSAIIPGSGGVKIFFTADNNGTVGEALISENYEVSFNWNDEDILDMFTNQNKVTNALNCIIVSHLYY